MNCLKSAFASIALGSLLSACSGGGGGEKSSPAPTPAPVPEPVIVGPLAEYNSMKDASSGNIDLSGKAIVIRTAPSNSFAMSSIDATLNASTRDVSYSNGTSITSAAGEITATTPTTANLDSITIQLPPGVTAKEFTDGIVNADGSETKLFFTDFNNTNYEYSQLVTAGTKGGGHDVIARGYYGVATDVADVNIATGFVGYDGQAYGELNIAGVETAYTAESNVIIDFSKGRADVLIRNLSTFDKTTLAPVQKPVTQIDLTNMVVSGNELTGGKLTIYDRDTIPIQQFTNRTPTASSAGLYGFDAAEQAPDEVAGTFQATINSNYSASGSYIAD